MDKGILKNNLIKFSGRVFSRGAFRTDDSRAAIYLRNLTGSKLCM